MPGDATTNHVPAARPGRRQASATAPRASAPDAVAVVRDLARAGQHAQAVDIVTVALIAPGGDEYTHLALLELRAESLTAQGEVDRALTDAKAMVAIAEASGRPDLQAQALNCLSRVQLSSGGIDAAVTTAGQALKRGAAQPQEAVDRDLSAQSRGGANAHAQRRHRRGKCPCRDADVRSAR